MKVSTKLRYLRITPRKVRLVADLIRGKSVEEATVVLKFLKKRAALPLLKLLKSAIASAQNNFQLQESNLYISEIFVGEGPTYKRWMPRARGALSEIKKRTSHVTIFLGEIEKKPTKVKKGKKEELVEKEIKEVSKPKIPKPKIPRPKSAVERPRIGQRIKRVFRRKAF